MSVTELSITQINEWFQNKRKRNSEKKESRNLSTQTIIQSTLTGVRHYMIHNNKQLFSPSLSCTDDERSLLFVLCLSWSAKDEIRSRSRLISPFGIITKSVTVL